MEKSRGRLGISRMLFAVFFVLTVFCSCIIQGSIGAGYYLLSKQDCTLVCVPPVILENGTAGSNTIFANATSARTQVNSTVDWWNTNYTFRQRLTVTNNNLTTNIPPMFTQNFTLNTQQLVSTGKMRPDGNDLRIAWWNSSSASWLEIDRLNITNFNTPSTTVRFGTQKTISPGGIDGNYYVYYGNSQTVAAPSNGGNVYLFEDNFDRTASSTVGSGWVEHEAGGSDARIASNPLVSTNVLDLYGVNNPMDTIAEHAIQGINSTGKCIWEFGFVWDRDAAETTYEVYMQVGNGSMTTGSPWLGVGPFISWAGLGAATTGRAASAHEMLRAFDDDQIPTEVEIVSGGANLTVEIDFSRGNLSLRRDGIFKGTYDFYQRLATYDRIRFVSDQITATSIVKRGFDYARVYLSIDPNPSVGIGAEENWVTRYDHVLGVNNTVMNPWQIRLSKYADSNVNRLQNCTIYFHNSTDGRSNQISVQNGVYVLDTGLWYDAPSSSTIFIGVLAQTNNTGLSRIYTYLDVRVANTTTYIRYIIEVEVN